MHPAGLGVETFIKIAERAYRRGYQHGLVAAEKHGLRHGDRRVLAWRFDDKFRIGDRETDSLGAQGGGDQRASYRVRRTATAGHLVPLARRRLGRIAAAGLLVTCPRAREDFAT